MSLLSSNGSDFEKDPRRIQELSGRPIADKIYRSFFGTGIEIRRRERAEEHILDRTFALDVEIKLPNGNLLQGQEKFLSSRYAARATVTVEYEQNQYTGEPGDWFHLAAQFYFVGYFTPDGQHFSPWVILDWPAVVLGTLQGKIQWKTSANKNGRALASFRYTEMAGLLAVPGCVWASQGLVGGNSHAWPCADSRLAPATMEDGRGEAFLA